MIKFKILLLFPVLFWCMPVNATVHEIEVEDNEFNPSNINVGVGDTITWRWDDSDGNHTTTSTAIPAGAIPWDQPINESSSTFSYVVLVSGSYGYHCTIHTGMTGSFDVGSGTAIYSDGIEDVTILISPNPVTNAMCIYYKLPEDIPQARVQILDINGNIVYDRITEVSKLSDCIETTGYSKGVYMLKVSTDEIDISAHFVIE